MIIHRAKSGSGIYFRLETEDFKFGDWKGFLARIKKLDKWEYKPPELGVDEDAEWWWIGNESIPKFIELKKAHLDFAIAREKQFIADGYKPIPRVWRRKR